MGINVQSKTSRNQLNLPHGTEIRPEMQKKRWEARAHYVSPGEREDLWWEEFVKEVGFELGVKEW